MHTKLLSPHRISRLLKRLSVSITDKNLEPKWLNLLVNVNPLSLSLVLIDSNKPDMIIMNMYLLLLGYEMPVQYKEGVLKEHLFTRESASLFDVSHMGQIK